MTYYPDVIGELETMRQVVAGASLARYGDGEFKMCEGSSIKSQVHHPALQRRLRAILVESGSCLVGIPNIRSNTPKADFWGPHMRFHPLLWYRPYYSAFVSRPDSAPWIDTPAYWDLVESLWKGQDVTLVGGSHKSLAPADLASASSVTHILCPKQHAYAEYDAIMARIGTPKRAILCLGPTATVMAVDLCAKGVHAIDLGHLGIFLRKHRAGLPMWLSKDDKSQATL